MTRRNMLAASAGAAFRAGTPRFYAGIQVTPISLLDEGIDRCLDVLRGTAGVNSLMVYTHSYYSARGLPPDVYAPDHGVPLRDERKRNLRRNWVRHNETRFAGTSLRHEPPSPGQEYADRDLFAELAAPARRRGMTVYARILEPQLEDGTGFIRNFERVVTVDAFGKRGRGPCWNHPEYREWIRATVEDLFLTYELDGFQYGAERVGPLSETLLRNMVPACFCEHCNARGKARGIDPGRARRGYRELWEFGNALWNGGGAPADGVFVTVLRFFHRFPELLSWNQSWIDADEDIARLVYRTIKRIKPGADVGRHVDHQRSSWDLFYRAAAPYEAMAGYADFVKPILYHDILGPRMRWWVVDRMQKLLLRDLPPAQSLPVLYALLGWDAEKEPALEELEKEGFSPDYVYRETRRCLAGVAEKARVYAGIGFDVPWNDRRHPSSPQKVYEATVKAIEAGAHGVLASRNYAEMRLDNLRAFGRALRDKKKVQP